MKDKNNRIKSEQYFHILPENLNCAQAILKGFQKEFSISDQEIEEYRAFGGGRVQDGICGALFSAGQLLKKAGKPDITNEFNSLTGGIHCKEIKGHKFPCINCVRIADLLIEEKIK